MTIHDRYKIIAAAKEAGFSRAPPKFKHWRGTISDVERLYAIAFEDGRQAEREEINQDAERYRWLRTHAQAASALKRVEGPPLEGLDLMNRIGHSCPELAEHGAKMKLAPAPQALDRYPPAARELAFVKGQTGRLDSGLA